MKKKNKKYLPNAGVLNTIKECAARNTYKVGSVTNEGIANLIEQLGKEKAPKTVF